MKQIFVVLVLISLSIFPKLGNSQTSGNNLDNLKNIVPPSPNSSGFVKYADWPINLYNGVPSISIPVYELKGRSISIPISLSYHAAGNKVGEIASWVGLGWSLNAGGAISRSVKGLPDDDDVGGFFVKRQQYTDKDNLCSIASGSLAVQHQVQTADGNADAEQDIYNLNALGKSYKLLFKGDGSIITIPYSNVKINTNFQNTATNSNTVYWEIILEDGTKLNFGGGDGFIEKNTNPRFSNLVELSSYVSSWYLKSVTSANGEVINFTYNSALIDQDSYFSESDYIEYSTLFNYNTINESGRIAKAEKQQVTVLNLATIESDLGRVEFIQNTAERLDLKGGNSLGEVKVYSKLNNAYIQNYKFSYSYTQSTSGNELISDIAAADLGYYRNRLKLIGIEKAAVGQPSIDKWKFNYDPQNLPSRRSYAQDHWGFYNGATNNTTLLPLVYFSIPSSQSFPADYTHGFIPSFHELGANRGGDTNYMKAEILTKITYPTGGTSDFSYEGNSYPANEEIYKDTTLSLHLVLPNSPYNNTISIPFTITKAQYVRLTNTSFVSAGFDRAITTKVQILDGNGTAILGLNASGSQWFSLRSAGTYTFVLSSNVLASDFAGTQSVDIAGLLQFSKSLGIQNINKLAGGLRIKSIVESDGQSNANNIQRFFKYDSSFVINAVDLQLDYLTLQDRTDNCTSPTKEYRKATRIANTKFSAGSIQGGTIGYGKVTVLYGPNAENGKSVSYFSNEPDADITASKLFPYPAADSRDWRRGLLMQETEFSSSQKKVKETINQYDFLRIKTITGFKAGYNRMFCTCTDMYQNCGIQHICYNITSEQVRSLSTIQKSFSSSTNDSLVTTTSYFYDNPNNLSPTRTEMTNSKGSVMKSITRTPLEKSDINIATPLTVSAAVAIDSMIKRNIISPVLQQEQYNNGNLITRSLVNYKIWDAANIAPENIQLQNGTNSIETRVLFNKYDSKGNLSEQQKVNDAKRSYVYDYVATYPVAEVINADSASFAFTSFEADGKGNWAFSGAPISDPAAITGKKIYDPVNGVITKQIVTPGNYVISYWSKNGAKTINGTTIKSGRNVNGWTYYEHNGTFVANAIVTVSGNGVIDELRLYPASSQMKTYTYEPLIGQTSMSDPNGEIVYYEYDNFNRLKNIKDYQGNIVKNFQYNYQNSCGANCVTFRMQTLTGSNTLGYPVGVFNVNRDLIDTAVNAAAFVSIWNSNSANQLIGTLAVTNDPLIFQLSLLNAATAPANIIGCRYYQYDFQGTTLDGVLNINGDYVDFGDGYRMKLGRTGQDRDGITMPPNTISSPLPGGPYWIHTYANSNLKTLTFYHSDDNKTFRLDNKYSPASSLLQISNLRGNIPQYLYAWGQSSVQSASALSMSKVTNWPSIKDCILEFVMNAGDGSTPCANLSMPQDFLKDHPHLQQYRSSWGGCYNMGIIDPGFRISLLKSDWNTYFKDLNLIQISDAHWNREDLSQLTNLKTVLISCRNQNNNNNPTNNPPIPMPAPVVDNIIIQIAAGAGQSVKNGILAIDNRTGPRTSASDAAVNFLKSRGWVVNLSGVIQ